MGLEKILGVLVMSSSEWKTVKLIEIVDTQIDNRGRNPDKYLDYSDHPVIDNYLIKNQKYPDMSEVKRYINKDIFENFLRGYLKKDDVLITMVGNGIGNVTMAPSNKSVIVQNTIGLRTNKNASNTFLYYLLLFYQDEIKNFNRGTSQPSIKKTDLFNLAIQIPPLQEQKAIAHILSTLDDKIEVNNQINKTLENMAQAIFKQWFVDFEFPNEDGEPYKSSGGQMIESELGLIPKGWEVKGLDEIAEFLNGLAMQKFRPAETEKAYPVLKIKELRQGRTDESSDLCSCNIDDKYIVRDGDIIFSWSGSLLVDIWCGGTCGLNQHLFKVTSDKFDEWFIYQWNKYHLDRFDRIAKSKATTMGHIKRKDLSDSKVLVPSNEIYLKAAQHQKYLFEKIKFLKVEMKRLEKIRNSLLPKLMSGEIRVPLDEEGEAS